MKKIFNGLFVILSILVFTACDPTTNSTNNKIEVNFESNGGTSISVVYLELDELIPIPKTTKVGHTLEGWYTSLDGGVTLDKKWDFSDSTVNNDITLYANWNINRYSLDLVTCENFGTKFVDLEYNQEIDLFSGGLPDGYEVAGLYLDENYTIPYEYTHMPAMDLVVYVKWTEVAYKIIIVSEIAGFEDTEIEINYCEKIELPEPLEVAGYSFIGFYFDSNYIHEFTLNEMMPMDIIVYAKWEATNNTN